VISPVCVRGCAPTQTLWQREVGGGGGGGGGGPESLILGAGGAG